MFSADRQASSAEMLTGEVGDATCKPPCRIEAKGTVVVLCRSDGVVPLLNEKYSWLKGIVLSSGTSLTMRFSHLEVARS